ncbi:MAG: ferredoxin--NADP reductase [Legionellaceae bacterium]|nr:ferredoxin--NADP reductase [Legionellaceae bacterium]
MQTNTSPIILENTYMLSPSVKHFIFHSKHEPAFNFIAGQFITIHFEHQGKILRRSYSIANTPANDNHIEFAASYVKDGPGTELLFNLKIGDTIQITGPFGRLTLKDDTPKRYVLLATSTGVTPYRAMKHELQRRLDSNPNLHIVIMLGVQKRADILYGDEFLAWAATSPRVTFRAHLSRDHREDWLPHEYSGHIQTGFSELDLNPEHDLVYLCGNPAMIDDAFALLKDKGFTTQHVIREKYISSK